MFFAAVISPELLVAAGQIHPLDHRIEGEGFILQEALDFVPLAERAEGVEPLQEKLARLEGALERDGVEFALVFAFAVEPAGEDGERLVARLAPGGDGLGDEGFAPGRVGMHLEVERDQFLRRTTARVRLECLNHFCLGHDRGIDHDLVRPGEDLLGENGQGVERDLVRAAGQAGQALPGIGLRFFPVRQFGGHDCELENGCL